MDQLIPFPANDRPLARQVIGTRHYVEVHEQLQAMTSDNRQKFVRDAVEAALAGQQSRPDAAAEVADIEGAIATVLPTIPLRDRAIAAKAFKKLVAHLERN